MNKLKRTISKILILTIILTSGVYTSPASAEEADRGVIETTGSQKDRLESREGPEEDTEDQVYSFDPSDWEIIENGSQWILKEYRGTSKELLYIPAVYKNNGKDIEITLQKMSLLNQPVERVIIEEVGGKKVGLSNKHVVGVFNNRTIKKMDLSGLDTRGVSIMESMFASCTNLEELNITGLDTSAVTSMKEMFYNCANLRKIDLSGLDISRVESMESMFFGAKKLEEVNLKGLNSVSVKDMKNMFKGCNELKVLDMSNMDTSSVVDMSSMFSGCSSLPDVEVPDLNTSSVVDMGSMFNGCKSFKGFDLSKLDTSNVENMKLMFSGCENLEEINIRGVDSSKVINMNSMFRDCSSLPDIDLANLDTSNVVDMGSIFSGCKNLEEINISGIDSSKVTNMSYMFNECSGLPDIDLANLNTSNVVDMSSMFRKCKSLNSVDISKLNTSSLVDMSLMFSECESFVEADLSKIETSKVENMESLFSSCTNLKSVNMSGLDASKVKDMNRMFSYCVNLRDVNMKNVKISSLEDISHMFEYCVSLKDLDLSSFSLLGRSDYSYAIEGCINLESLDIGNFKTGIPLEYEIDLRENNPFGTNRKLKKLTLPKIVRGEELKGLLAISSIDYIDLDIEKDAGHLGEQNFYQPDNNWYIEGLGIGFQELLEDQLTNFIDVYYEDDKYMDILVEKDILTREELESTGSPEELVGKICEKLDGLNSYEDKEIIFNVMEEVYELEVYELISQDDTNGLNTIIGDIQMIDILKRSAKHMEKGYPLLITTNNLEYFEEYSFEDDNRIPMELGPKISSGDGQFKDGSNIKNIFTNEKIVYLKEDLKSLKITRRMLDELIKNVNLINGEGKELTVSGILDESGNLLSLDELVGLRIVDERDKIYTLVYGDAVVEVKFNKDGEERAVKLLKGKTLKEEDIPSTDKEGYDFLGWYEKEGGSGEAFDLSQPITGDVDLYAVYKKKAPEKPIEPEDKPVKPEEKPSEPTDPEPGVTKDYEVSFIKDGSEKVVRVEEGKKIKREDIPATDKEGYDFLGWYEKKDGSGELFDFSQGIYKDTKLYAVYKERVKIESHLAYLKGYEDASLRPLGDMTREEVAMVFYRILDKDYRNKIRSRDHGFRDVEAGRWSEEAIASLAKEGILVGYEDGSFKPGDKISRAELSTILAKLLSSGRTIETEFPDVKGHWAEGYITIIEEKGWIEGYEDGSFRPDKKIRRNEFTKMINRYLERGVFKENIPGDILEFNDFNKSHKNEWYYEDMVEATNNHKYKELDSKEIWTELFN